MFDIHHKHQLMQAYIDGMLDERQAASFRAEMAADAALREEYEQLCALDAQLKQLGAADIEPPADFAALVMQRVAAEPQRAAGEGKRFPWRIAAPVMTAAALLLAVGVSGILPKNPVIVQPADTTVSDEPSAVVVTEPAFTAPEPTIVIPEPVTTAAEPTTVTEPVTEVEPTTAVEPVTEVEPTTAAEPVTEVEPTTAVEPVTEVEPTTAVEPVTEVEPTTAAEPATVVEPTTAVEPATTAPVKEPEQTRPVQPSKPAVEPTAPVSEPDPVETVPEPGEEPISGSVPMPVPGAQTVTIAGGLEVMRFGIVDGDAYSPFLNSVGEIQFYTEYEGQKALCTVMHDTASVEILEDCDVAKRESYAGAADYLMQFSPDGTQIAANMAGEGGGLWLSDNNSDEPPACLSPDGGGNILQWAPNSGKLVFTDAQGSLYVVYTAEGLVFRITEQPVYNVLWLSDSRSIIFETVEDGSRVICRATLP